jgi:hypothetical protein
VRSRIWWTAAVVALGALALVGPGALRAESTAGPADDARMAASPAARSEVASLPVAAPAPPSGLIAPGVRIAGVDVAGLTRASAASKVLREVVAPRRRPLVVTFRGRRIGVRPAAFGYAADVRAAVHAAFAFGRSRGLRLEVDVPLRQSVDRARIRAFLQPRARRLHLPPRDASLTFDRAKPIFAKPRVGRAIDVPSAERLIASAILERTRTSFALPARRLLPSRISHPTTVLVERSTFRLSLFRKRSRETFPIAVGQPAYPTPSGSFSIVTKQVDPTWFPPDSPWAAGIGPVPPGVDNPLGTRWMGLSAPGLGIHGTPQPETIGTAASHGCIRMRMKDAEYLFARVAIGTPVVIV